ncbi:unnamed protein product [Closterium sp. Yama58-4]|nr:unnamed protein product [Closterium sp. Yama58-4]
MASDPAPSTDKWMNFLTEANLDDDTYVPGVLLPSQPALEQVACSAEGGGGNTEEGEKTGSSSRKRSRDEGAATADVSCSKANREKMRRDRLNDRFLELSRSLEPGKAPKADKASILCDAVRVLSQLRAEREALKENNAALQEQIKELKAEKHELREEKARLKAETNPYFGKGLTAKLPPALFGKRCGACYNVQCHNDTKRCRKGKAIVTVRIVGETTTEKQLSLSAVSWSKIVQGTDAAPVHITYKRTNCVSTVGSGVRVRRNSTAEKFNIQMVGLAGPGTLTEVELSADGKKWVKLTRDGSKAVWGIAGAEAKEVVGAKAMSVRLTAGHTLEKITLDKVIPANWKPSTLYSSKTNFKKLMAESK